MFNKYRLGVWELRNCYLTAPPPFPFNMERGGMKILRGGLKFLI